MHAAAFFSSVMLLGAAFAASSFEAAADGPPAASRGKPVATAPKSPAAKPVSAEPQPSTEVHLTLLYETPGSRACHVNSWVQFVRLDSLDLVRRAPRMARLARLEIDSAEERWVLQPRAVDPELYRAPVPRHAPLAWTYDLQLASADSLGFAIGSDYACLWLGGLLLVPLDRERAGKPALPLLSERNFPISVFGPASWKLFHGWPAAGDDAERPNAWSLADEFVALGNCRQTNATAESRIVTMGKSQIDDATWADLVSKSIAAAPNVRGREPLVFFIAPGPPHVFAAKHSYLITWPSDLPAPQTQDLQHRIATARRLE